MGRSTFVLSLLFIFGFVIMGCSSQSDVGVEVAADVSTVASPRATSTNTAVPTATAIPTQAPTLEPTVVENAAQPYVVDVAPTILEANNRKPDIEVAFSEPMVFGVLLDAVNVEPEIELSLRLNGNVLTITPEKALLPGVRYTFSIDEQVMAENGEAMERPYRWDYRLPQMVANYELPTIDDLQQPIRIQFNYAINPDLDQIHLDPPISGTSEWSEGNTVLTFFPEEPLLPDVNYRIYFTGGWAELGGAGDLLVEPEPIRFKIAHGTMHTFPANDEYVHPASVVRIDFVLAMDLEHTKAAFKIEPAVPGVLEWHDNTLELHPVTDRLLPDTTYTVTLLETAVNANGQPILSEPFSWIFHTTSMYDLGSFGDGDGVQALTLNGYHAVQYQYRAEIQQPVSFDLYQVQLANWLAGNEEGVLVTTWDAPEYLNQEYYIQVQETVLPEVEAGIYRLVLRSGTYVEDELVLFLSDHLISVAQDEEMVSAWIMDENGAAAADTMVRVYADETEVANARTGQDGYVQIPVQAKTNFKLVAETGENKTVIALNNDWRNGSYFQEDGEYLIHTTTDRPAYRAGEDVHFRTIIRQDKNGRAEIVPAGTPVLVELFHHPSSEVVASMTVESNHFGSINGTLSLPNKEGDYTLRTTIGEKSVAVPLAVSMPIEAPFIVEIETDRPAYAEDEEMAIEIMVRDAAGNPLPDVSVSLNQYEAGNNSCWGSTGQADQWYYSYRNVITRTTDENGRIQLNLDAELGYFTHNVPLSENAQHGVLALHAVATENGRSADAFTVVEISNVAQYITTEVSSHIQSPNVPFTVSGVVQDLYGNPVNGRSVTLKVLVDYPDHVDQFKQIMELILTTDAAGKVNVPVTIPEPGKYEIVLISKDSFGTNVRHAQHVIVYDSSNQTVPEYTQFIIHPDQNAYPIDSTARLLIEAPTSGPAWLTVSRNGIYHQELVQLTAPMTLVEVPITAEHTPNVFVTVQQWRVGQPYDGEPDYMIDSSPDQILHKAITNLKVIDPSTTLHIELETDQAEYQAGETAEFTIRVLNHKGEPVSAEVAFSLVDAALFANYSPHAAEMGNIFQFARQNKIDTYDSMAARRVLGDFYGGCGCGGGAEYVREELGSHYLSTTLWNPSLVTDHNGEATFTITMPHAVGDWRVTLQAVSADTQLGDTAVTISTK